MPVYIEDHETTKLVERLAKRLGLTREEAVKRAVIAALEGGGEIESLHVRLQRIRAAHPLPPATGFAADKAFFDELSGEP